VYVLIVWIFLEHGPYFAKPRYVFAMVAFGHPATMYQIKSKLLKDDLDYETQYSICS
jgi:hypothetical protein